MTVWNRSSEICDVRSLLWRFVEWRLNRHLTPTELLTTLGDLDEDFAQRRRDVGSVRAAVWLIREARSVASAYKRRATGDQRSEPTSPMSVFTFDEVRPSIRRLTKHLRASIASIVTLACGIGVAAATYSLVSAVLLRPLPVAAADRLVEVDAKYLARGGTVTRLATGHVYPVFTGLSESGAFANIAAGGQEPRLVLENGQAQQRNIYFASHGWFETLGIRMQLGPGFSAENDRRDAPLTAVISHRYWQRVLNADPAVIGRTMTIANTPATIVGVTPPRFRGLNLATAPDLYLPLQTLRAVSNPLSNYFADPVEGGMSSPFAWLTIIGRLKPEATMDGTLVHLNALPGALRANQTLVLTPLDTAAIPERARAGMAQFARLLSITVGLLLVIAGLTVGMLLLIRTEARRDELAMCLALGASRKRLASGIAIEAGILSLAGALVAVPVAWLLFRGLTAFQLPGRVDIDLLDLRLDIGAFFTASAIAVALTFLIAAIAGVFGFTAKIADVLRSRAGSTPTLSRRRTRSILVIVQVAISLVLLGGAGLFARSLMAALQLNAGFDPHRLVSGSIELAPYGYTMPRATAFVDELRARLASNPAIASLSFTQRQASMSGQIKIDGEPRQVPSLVEYASVDDHYFRTMSMRIVAGRDFSPDDTLTSPLVIIVSESFGRWLAEGGNALGHTVTEISRPAGQPFAVAEVVGVVPDVVINVAAREPLAVYYASAQKPASRSATILMRATSDTTIAAREARDAIRAIDPAVTPAPMLTLQEQIGRQMGPQQFGALVLGVLGGIAVLLTILGAYVLAESLAAVRQREMGIRAALGATRTAIGRIVLLQTVRLVGFGLLIGLGGAWLGAGLIRSFLFHVQPYDPTTVVAVSATILGLALAVSLRPAISTARLDLARILREE
jgi:putative ABC transport system permease protein